VFQKERKKGNIGKQVLFPYVSVPVPCFRKDSPPPYFLAFVLKVTKKKSPKKKTLVRDFTAFQGPQGDG